MGQFMLVPVTVSLNFNLFILLYLYWRLSKVGVSVNGTTRVYTLIIQPRKLWHCETQVLITIVYCVIHTKYGVEAMHDAHVFTTLK